MKQSSAVAMCNSILLCFAALAPAAEKPKPYRLPAIPDRMQAVIWGDECKSPDEFSLAFGGEALKSDDGQFHTHFTAAGGESVSLIEKLRAENPLQKLHDRIWNLRTTTKNALAKARFIYFEGRAPDAKAFNDDVLTPLRATADELAKVANEYKQPPAEVSTAYSKNQLSLALMHIGTATGALNGAVTELAKGVTAETIKGVHEAQVKLEQAAELLDAEPGARALSPLVYDAKNKLFILFGGDHLDYLTNDTWIFDPAQKVWQQRHPKGAPAPRANHQLAAADGAIKLSGGYTYSNNTDYMGGPYIDINDGDWVYDVAADTWKSERGVQANADGSRTYRQGAFHPDFFLQGEKPDAAAFAATLREMPANTWVQTRPPHLPQMQRDWGTAVIDPDHDVLLRWSGGHCAHGGSDVVMYHFSTNRWELPFPVELPLGQCYTNTSYPIGYNFNLRPWVTGHTYKSYAYDAVSKRMISAGQQNDFLVYNPGIGDWETRAHKPNGMTYGGCFYDLLCKQTPKGIACWTKEGRLFFYEGKTGGEAGEWTEKKLSGDKIPGSNVDSAGIDHDSKRDRMLLFPGNYGKPYSGQIVSVDLKTGAASMLNPAGMAGAARMPGFLRETCYVASQDWVLSGVTLPADDGGVRWTPVYDCAANKWIACKIDGTNPAGKEGRNVSLGLVYDAKRDLIWAVDTRGGIFVLRLDAKTVNKRDL